MYAIAREFQIEEVATLIFYRNKSLTLIRFKILFVYLYFFRSLGPAVIQAYFENHWIFWVGPLLGGLCAGIHHLIVEKLQSKKTEVQAAPENKTEEGIENPAVSMTSIVP